MRPKRISIGFTGTRRGMTGFQRDMVKWHLNNWWTYYDEIILHHGNCVGSDRELVLLAKDLVGFRIIGHPMVGGNWQASTSNNDETLDARPPLIRNKAIVVSSQILLATPREHHEVLRSGTWTTIRYAWARPIPVIIIPPTGSFGQLEYS